jgi:uncharacterized protein (TIRG00374 family)
MNKLLFLALASFFVLFFWLLQWAGIQEMAAALLNINPVYVPLIILLPFATLLVYGVRWNLLLKSVGINTRWGVVYKYAFIGAAFNNITPMVRFGGEPLKCYLLSKEISVGKRTVLASLAMDSLITGISLLVLIYLGAVSLALFRILDLFMLNMILTIIILPLFLGAYMLYNRRLLAAASRRFSGLVRRFSPESAKELPEIVMAFRDNIGNCLRRYDIIAAALVLALAERALEVLGLYVVFQALGISLDVFLSAIVLGVGVIAGLLPFLPGGLVAYESTTIIVLRLFNVSPALAATSILMWRGVTYWLVTAIGLALGWMRGVRFALRSAFRSAGDVASAKI